MYNKLTPLTIWVLLLFSIVGSGQIITVSQTLEAMAPELEVSVRSDVETQAQSHSEIRNLVGNHAFIVPPRARASREDDYILNSFAQKLFKTPYGQKLVETTNENGKTLELRLFHDVPLENGRVNWTRPMWENDKLIRHELMGAYHSKDGRGIIALNNHQSKDVAVYTFAHELFHLIDGNNPTGDAVDEFLAEYRAILAETIVYFQSKAENKNSKAMVRDVFIESKWHEDLIDKAILFGEDKIDIEKVKKATLDLLYPMQPSFRIGRIVTVEDRELIDEEMNTYGVVLRALVKILNGNSNISPSVIEFQKQKEELRSLSEKNIKIRNRIENYFSKDDNKKLLELNTINNLNPKNFNNAYQGHGGPRPRGPGG